MGGVQASHLYFANTPMLHYNTLSLGVMIVIPCKTSNYSSRYRE